MIEGIILSFAMQVWKWLTGKFGVETSRKIVHCILGGVSLIIAILQYWGNWWLLLTDWGTMWTTASGFYEVAIKFLLPNIPVLRSIPILNAGLKKE